MFVEVRLNELEDLKGHQRVTPLLVTGRSRTRLTYDIPEFYRRPIQGLPCDLLATGKWGEARRTLWQPTVPPCGALHGIVEVLFPERPKNRFGSP